MIKNLEKDLRTYRKDTFITSFFATITILLIVLIICSVPSHAQEVSGGENDNTYSYDTDDFVNWLDVYEGIDITKTNPTGVLNLEDNPLYEVDNTNYPGVGLYNKIPLNAYYFQSPNPTLNGIFNGNTIMNIPETFTYDGVQYDTSSYENFYYMVWSEGAYCSLIISKSSLLMSVQDTYRKWYQPIGTDSFILYYPNGSTSNPVIKRPVEQRISGHDVDDNVNILNISYYDALVYTNSSATCEMNELKDENGWYWVEQKYNEIELNYLNGQDGNGGSGGSSDENEENNMYLKSADFKFNIHKYGDIENNDSTADNYDFAMANMSYKNYWGNKSGLIDFECVPTDYQIEHSQEFYLYFQFNLIQRFDALSPSFHLEPNPILSPFKAHSINTTTTTSFYNKIYFHDLIENSNRVTWRIDELFDDLKITACNVPYLTGVSNNDTFNKAVAQERELSGVIWKNDNNLGYVIQCYAFLGCDTQTYTDAGSYSETYGFCSQVSRNTDDSITTNPNPYVPSDDTDSDGKPDSSQTVVNDGNVSLINNNYDNDNNNQTVNITSDDAELVDTLTDKFIPSNMDNTGGLTTQFTELANTNGYITFFKNTFSFVPVAVWNTLLVLLGTTCSIIAVAFVIKVLRGM